MDTSLLLPLATYGSCGVGVPFIVFTGMGGGGHGQIGLSIGAVADAGNRPGGEDQDHGVIQGPTPRVGLAVRVVLRAAVLGTGLAELAESNRVTAGLGQEVAAEAEHVRPSAQRFPRTRQGGRASTRR